MHFMPVDEPSYIRRMRMAVGLVRDLRQQGGSCHQLGHPYPGPRQQ